MNKKQVYSERAFFAVFSCYLVYRLFSITMFYKYIPDALSTLFMFAASGVALIKFMLRPRISRRHLFWMAIALLAMLITGILSGYRELITTFCLILGAEGIRMERIVRRYCYITTTIIFFTLLCVRLGIIQDYVWNVSWDNLVSSTKRHGMGFVYPTDFVSCVFYLLCGFVYLRQNERFRLRWLIMIIGVAALTYYYCLTRLDSGCIVLLGVGYTITTVRRDKPISRVLKIASLAAIPVCAALSLWASAAYNGSDVRWLGLDYILSRRLYYGNLGIRRYGFSLLGQYVYMRGNSVLSANINTEYFYLDCSYLNIALRYGMICLVVVCSMLIFQCYQHIRTENRAFLIIMILVAVNSMIAHHLFDGYTNVFIFAALADITVTGRAKRRRRNLLGWGGVPLLGQNSRGVSRGLNSGGV